MNLSLDPVGLFFRLPVSKRRLERPNLGRAGFCMSVRVCVGAAFGVPRPL